MGDSEMKREMSGCLTVLGKPKHFFIIRPKFFASTHLESKSYKKRNTVRMCENNIGVFLKMKFIHHLEGLFQALQVVE